MSDKNKILSFLSNFWELENIEISNLRQRFSIDDIVYYNEQRWDNVYFCWNVDPEAERCSNDTIISKNYFYLDFDVRQGRYEKDKYIMTDEEVFEIWEKIKTALNDSILLWWRFFVFSGNGFQVHRIWKEPMVIDKNTYSKAMKFIMNYCAENILKRYDIDVKLDMACSNIARVWRLPYTYNHSRVKKFWLEPRKAEVRARQTKEVCELIDLETFTWFANEYWEEVIVDKDTTEYKPKECVYDGENEMEAINAIPIENLIFDYCWLKIDNQGKNFKSPKDWENTGMFVKDNCVIYTGTHYIHQPSAWKDKKWVWWNCFWFVREHYWLSTEETFKWFEDRYFYIKEIADRNRKLYREQMEKEEQEQAKEKIEKAKNITPDDITQEKQKLFEWIKDIDNIYRWWKAVERMTDNLNENIWKILLGSMNIMVWAPNSWKTTFMYVMIMHNLKKWLKVWLLTYEMRLKDIIEQYYFWQIWAMGRYDSAIMTEEDNQKTMEYKKQLIMNENFYSCENLSCKFTDLKADIEKMKKFWADVVFIDNLIKIRWTTNEFADNTAVIEYLYQVSKETWMAIILLHHSDKTSANKNEFWFRWTGDVLIKPDNVFFLKRPWLKIPADQRDRMSADDKAELIVRKQKQRSWTSKIWEERVYFYKWWYYTLSDWGKKMSWF